MRTQRNTAIVWWMTVVFSCITCSAVLLHAVIIGFLIQRWQFAIEEKLVLQEAFSSRFMQEWMGVLIGILVISIVVILFTVRFVFHVISTQEHKE